MLGPDGRFADYCRDYSVPPGRIAFSPSSIRVLCDADGQPLHDIRNTSDNAAAADRIFSLIREWIRRPDEILHCSVAGGRKTMGIYLAMSLMLCGRSGDTLSHVLVPSELESATSDFFYPRPTADRHGPADDSDPLRGETLESTSPDPHKVELADIPFPRLCEILGGDLPFDKGLTEAVAHSQLLLAYLQEMPELRVRLDTGRLDLGSLSFKLPRQLLAVYVLFLTRFTSSHLPPTMEELYEHRLELAELERSLDRLRQGEREAYAWERMKTIEDFRDRMGPCISKVNRAIDGALGDNRLAAQLRISTGGRYSVSVRNFRLLISETEPWAAGR